MTFAVNVKPWTRYRRARGEALSVIDKVMLSLLRRETYENMRLLVQASQWRETN